MGTEKYKIICKSCNHVHGYSKTTIVQDMPMQCGNCASSRMAVELNISEDKKDQTYDIFVVNKINNVTKHEGFIIKSDSSNDKEYFIEQSALALGRILTDKNIKELL